MNTSKTLLQVGGIESVVFYKPVKNLHLNVLPPFGKVRVTAPQNMTDDAVRAFLASRISWIKKMQKQFNEQDRQSKRKYVSGESHYLFGRMYKLDVVIGNLPAVKIKNKKTIVLTVRPKSNLNEKEVLIRNWYKNRLDEYLKIAVPKWEKMVGVKSNEWKIRRMKTRWGSCNHGMRKIQFNLELAKKSEKSIDYVVLHELIHIKERTHNDIFIKYMDQYMRNWKSIRDELNSSQLGYIDWSC